MTHLTPEELVDLLDGALPARRRAHLAACAECRDDAATMGAVFTRVRDEAVPEPSPLFWGHLSTRIRAALDAPLPRPWRDWLTRPSTAVAAGLATIALAVGLTQSLDPGARTTAAVPAPAAIREPATPVASAEPVDDVEKDEAWALVRSVADDVAWDDAQAAGIATRPGSAERMALELSAREQSELARLIADEIKRPGM